MKIIRRYRAANYPSLITRSRRSAVNTLDYRGRFPSDSFQLSSNGKFERASLRSALPERIADPREQHFYRNPLTQ